MTSAGAREQAVLEIGHDPRAAARASAPNGAVTEVDGLHVAVSRIPTARLGVAVVVAAPTIVVSPVEDRVHALRRVASGGAAGGVVAVAGSGGAEDAVRLLTIQRDRCTGRASQAIVTSGFRAAEAAGRSLGEVIITAGLIINDRDEAGRAGAEGVLGSGVSNTSSGQRRDVGRGIVGAAFHLIERAAIGAVQCASGAVSGDAWCSARGVDVAGPSDDKGAYRNKAQSEHAGAIEAWS